MHIVAEVLILILMIFFFYIQAFIGLFYKPKKDLSGRTAVLTGGGGGIGRFICRELVQRRVKVALWDVNKAAADKVKEELQGKGFSNIYTYQCDITKKEDVQRVAVETRKDLGEINFLFNNAGILIAKDILDLSEAEIRRTFEVNTISHFWTIQEFLPSMLEKNYGHIVNTASMAGKVGVAWLTDYCASKFGVVGLSEALRLDIMRRGKDVKVTAVCPFFVNTPLVANVTPHCKPYSRFDKFLEPDDCARQLVEGMERNDQTVYIPSKMFPATISSMLLPRKAGYTVNEFAQSGFFPKDYKFH